MTLISVNFAAEYKYFSWEYYRYEISDLIVDSWGYFDIWLCSCKPPTRQVLFSILQLFISIWVGKCHTLQGQSLEKACSVCFGLQATFFYKKCKDSTTKHRKQSTKLKVKGRDLIPSQICSSMLRYKRQDVTVSFFSMLLLSSRLFPLLATMPPVLSMVSHQGFLCFVKGKPFL